MPALLIQHALADCICGKTCGKAFSLPEERLAKSRRVIYKLGVRECNRSDIHALVATRPVSITRIISIFLAARGAKYNQSILFDH